MQLILDRLCKRFDQKEVLKNAGFCFESGKIYALLGRNGAGKTTLMNCVSGDLPIDGGTVRLMDGQKEIPLSEGRIGYVLSTPVVPEFLTAREFLQFYIDVNRKACPNLKPPDVYLDYMHIAPADRDRLMRDYSHGMKSKVQMLIAMMGEPAVLLLDEPLTSFDVVVAEQMKQLLREIKRDKVVILSTHILELALGLCDEIVLLAGGALLPVLRQGRSEAEVQDEILAVLRADEGAADADE